MESGVASNASVRGGLSPNPIVTDGLKVETPLGSKG